MGVQQRRHRAPFNLAVLRGEVVDDPVVRALPTGAEAVQFDVATVVDGDRSTTQRVPVAWVDPPSRAVDAVRSGVDVVVVGSVRRRFFRVGGATQSRTEVVADEVVPTRRVASVRKVVERALERCAEVGQGV